MKKTVLLLLLLHCGVKTQAQVATKITETPSNIYVMDIANYDHPLGKLELKNYRFLTADNKKGFNNNPFFHDNQLFIAASKDGKQSDIFMLDLDKNTRKQLTFTDNESELVPRIMWDYKNAMALTTESNGTQRLHKFSLETADEPSIFGGSFDFVGNFLWLNQTSFAAFLTNNNNVVLVDATTGNLERVSAQCGTNLQMNERGDLFFLYKKNDTEGQIKMYDRKTGKNKGVIPTIGASVENFAVLPDNSFICAKGRFLYRFRLETDNSWQVAADLTELIGIRKITQVTANKKGTIAIVVE